MTSKILILALLPIIVFWVIAATICKTVMPKKLLSQGKSDCLSEAECFDPTEALYGFI